MPETELQILKIVQQEFIGTRVSGSHMPTKYTNDQFEQPNFR